MVELESDDASPDEVPPQFHHGAFDFRKLRHVR
jgi:hypothetical protein